MERKEYCLVCKKDHAPSITWTVEHKFKTIKQVLLAMNRRITRQYREILKLQRQIIILKKGR